MATLSLINITKNFGTFQAIRGIDLEVTDGEFVVFVGPSGCGKSTLLRMISGLEEADSGDIVLNGERVNEHTPFERKVAMVFQSYALYPHMTVAENMGFPLKMVNAKPDRILAEVQKAADVLQLGDLLDRKPDQLSGGQKQRVAMGRTIVRDPQLFLFDEPLSNLDADLRIEMRVEIEKLHKRLDATMIYVTHDQVEAMTLADRIVVLKDGLIEQVGSPLDLYENPVNKFVASFLGAPKISFLKAQLLETNAKESQLLLGDGLKVTVPFGNLYASEQEELLLGIRPEDLGLGGGDFQLPFELELHERLGPTSYLYGLSNGQRLIAEHKKRGNVSDTDADQIWVNAAHVHLFNKDGKSVKSTAGAGQ